MKKESLAVALLINFTLIANAQSFPKERLSDWQFRFYACKNVQISASIVIDMMRKYQITDQIGLRKLYTDIGPGIKRAVMDSEKAILFSEGEATFVSDLTFAVLSGMILNWKEPSDTRLLHEGSDLCIYTIDEMAR